MAALPIIADLDRNFPRVQSADGVRIWCVSHPMNGLFHRFHHTSPLSPSGRYVALSRMFNEARRPKHGEACGIVLIDLTTGEIREVYRSYGWDTQLGAHVQWGADDSELLFNDMDTERWEPFGVRFDPATGMATRLGHAIYAVSADGGRAVSVCLKRLARTQKGYGVVVPPDRLPLNSGAPEDDGIYVTDTRTGAAARIANYRHIAAATGLRVPPGLGLYGFHTLWNPQGDRIMAVLRLAPVRGRPIGMLITMAADGSDIQTAVRFELWAQGGNHPTWCPDGRDLLMNLNLDGSGLRFVRVRYDGVGARALSSIAATRGHPSLLPGDRYIVTDNTLKESQNAGVQRTPLRLIDLTNDKVTIIDEVGILADGADDDNSLRIDPHPALSRNFPGLVVYNGTRNGSRAVFIADISALTAS